LFAASAFFWLFTPALCFLFLSLAFGDLSPMSITAACLKGCRRPAYSEALRRVFNFRRGCAFTDARGPSPGFLLLGWSTSGDRPPRKSQRYRGIQPALRSKSRPADPPMTRLPPAPRAPPTAPIPRHFQEQDALQTSGVTAS
jgi:hypothetical protein